MALTIKKAILWRKELNNRPGALAKTIQPLVEAGANFSIMMGYAYPHNPKKSVLEIYPVLPKLAQLAKQIGFQPAKKISCLVAEGEDRPGLGEKIGRLLAQNNINITFIVVQTAGKKWTGIFGFHSLKEANKAQTLIKQAVNKKNSPKSKK